MGALHSQVDASSTAFVSCPAARPHAMPAGISAAQAVAEHGCLPLRIEEGLVSACSRLCLICSPPCALHVIMGNG
jgi:hypothetical protein